MISNFAKKKMHGSRVKSNPCSILGTDLNSIRLLSVPKAKWTEKQLNTLLCSQTFPKQTNFSKSKHFVFVCVGLISLKTLEDCCTESAFVLIKRGIYILYF